MSVRKGVAVPLSCSDFFETGDQMRIHHLIHGLLRLAQGGDSLVRRRTSMGSGTACGSGEGRRRRDPVSVSRDAKMQGLAHTLDALEDE